MAESDIRECTMEVMVRGAYKRYGPRNVVLNGLDMTVPGGSIYGLLGPSGCGKTTLLSSLVGRIRLDAGSIFVRASNKDNIGYMPQELALYTEFSIYETIAYYGRIFGMSTRKIKQRVAELLEFLELPDDKSTIENLSGGQQRRVSLCCALVHNPELLILDEPTVGLDPVLSQSIWKYMFDLSSTGNKTIIITTHYIEEARQAHTIGLMRAGVLLAEEAPNDLMVQQDCNTLEQTFLKLSYKQSSNSEFVEDSKIVDNYPTQSKKTVSPLLDGNRVTWRRISAQLMKNVYWMKRNIPIMMFLLMLPVVQSVLCNLCIGRDPIGLKVAVVNDELENGLVDCNSIPRSGCYFEQSLSCRYLDKLREKTIQIVRNKRVQVEYHDLESAKQAVRTNNAWGVLYFAPNYTEALVERINFTQDATDEALDLSEVKVYMDMSNQYIGMMLERDVLFGFISFLRDVFKDCGWPPDAADIPIGFHDAIYGSNNPSFVHFTVPALVGLFQFYLPMMFTVGAILMEKMNGMLERSLVAGITEIELTGTHLFVQLIVLSCQTLLMMIVLFVIFDNPLIGSLGLCLALLALVGLSGTCYGYMVSIICDSETAATFMGLGSFFPLAMLSGMCWPMEGMHYTLRAVGWLLPLSLSSESFRAISARGWGFSHPTVYYGFISSAGWSIYFIFISYLFIKWRGGLRIM